jgi:pyruvate formate lyase activating enzyme
LKNSALLGLATVCPFGVLSASAAPPGSPPTEDDKFIIEARFYEKQHLKIRCKLCPKECVIDNRERGYCGVRENRDGTYYTLVHSRPCTYHADPIEKKPFFHFHPGTLAFSISTAGCNVNCKFCQNWQISQSRPEQVRSIYMPPERVATLAKEHKCESIAYTYGEPVVFFEYVADAAMRGREAGVKSVVVTGGYILEEPLRELCSLVDAIKVDVKAFSEEYYKEVVNGELKPVLDGLVTMRKQGTWIEIVYLVVPTLNDSDQEITGLCRWVRSELGPDVPIHFTRFHPDYLLKNLPPTPLKTLERAKAIGDAEGLHYVYIGNVPGHPAADTYCPGCGQVVIERTGFFLRANHLRGGECPNCQRAIAGVWGS